MAYWSNWWYKGDFYDITICKWQLNGSDYNDDRSTAYSDCLKIGYSPWPTEYIKFFDAKDKEMLQQYIGSSNCGR